MGSRRMRDWLLRPAGAPGARSRTGWTPSRSSPSAPSSAARLRDGAAAACRTSTGSWAGSPSAPPARATCGRSRGRCARCRRPRPALDEVRGAPRCRRELKDARPAARTSPPTSRPTLVDEPPASVGRAASSARASTRSSTSCAGSATAAAPPSPPSRSASAQRTGIASLKVRFNRVFGYYIEVSKSQPRRRCRADYIRKQTIAGGERFVTPELKEYEEKVLTADERIQDARGRALRGAARARGRRGPAPPADLGGGRRARRAGRAGRGRLPLRLRQAAPDARATSSPYVEGRHPVVERVLSEPFVANDLAHGRGHAAHCSSSPAPTWPASPPSCARPRSSR